MGIFRQLTYKWFGLADIPCATCEVLSMQLAKSESERAHLLDKLLEKDKVEPPPTVQEDFKPIQSQHVPWRVRQQMLEAEDRAKAAIMKNKEKEIAALEKELGVDQPATQGMNK